jgi:hypothetical protein
MPRAGLSAAEVVAAGAAMADEVGIGAVSLTAMFTAHRTYIAAHPGRYTATIGAEFRGEDDALLVAGVRVIARFPTPATGGLSSASTT